MININSENLIPLNAACKLIPGRGGKPISRATVWRWAMRGRRGVKLETLLLSGRVTSLEAVQRFAAKLNGTAPSNKPADQDREARRTEGLLDAEGL